MFYVFICLRVRSVKLKQSSDYFRHWICHQHCDLLSSPYCCVLLLRFRKNIYLSVSLPVSVSLSLSHSLISRGLISCVRWGLTGTSRRFPGPCLTLLDEVGSLSLPPRHISQLFLFWNRLSMIFVFCLFMIPERIQSLTDDLCLSVALDGCYLLKPANDEACLLLFSPLCTGFVTVDEHFPPL